MSDFFSLFLGWRGIIIFTPLKAPFLDSLALKSGLEKPKNALKDSGVSAKPFIRYYPFFIPIKAGDTNFDDCRSLGSGNSGKRKEKGFSFCRKRLEKTLKARLSKT